MTHLVQFLSRRRRQALLCCLTLVLVAAAGLTVAASVPIPQTRVQSVTDGTVSGQGWDFPAGATFNIRLGVMGSRGADGIVVGTTTVNADGTVAYSVPIPAEMSGQRQIAIRLDGYQNYYSYAWFWNPVPATDTGTKPPEESGQGGIPGYTGYPTFNIAAADAAAHTVTINGHNFPPNQAFTFRINSMGTRGVNGAVVGTLDSGAGGDVTATFSLPADWHGYSQLAIRADSAAGYFAYNWFWTGVAAPVVVAPAPAGNSTAGTGGQPAGSGPATAGPATAGPATAAPAAIYPTFSVASVARGATVTIVTRNLPADTDFTVIMGDFGTQGLRGYQV
ncbi:MAG: hypothetical protein KDE28_15085, partial [Anaerolineales bacterium]|nr:hypothetical protein [Anaerolineales bacterium]